MKNPQRTLHSVDGDGNPLGEFHARSMCATVIVTSGDAFPIVTFAHEALHRDLTIGSEIGLFERLLWQTEALVPQLVDAQSCFEAICEFSWRTHEGCAVHNSVLGLIGADRHRVGDYLATLPRAYREARQTFASLYGDLSYDDDTAFVLMQLTKCVAQCALDVSVLDAFRSPEVTTPASIRSFLGRQSPDEACSRMLDELRVTGQWKDHLARGLRLTASFPSLSAAANPVQERMRRASELDVQLLVDLKRLHAYPGLRETIEERDARFFQRQRGWLATFVPERLLRQVPTPTPRRTEVDASEEMSELLDHECHVETGSPPPFLAKAYADLPLPLVGSFVSAHASESADLLAFVLRHDDGTPPPVRELFGASEVLVLTWPWQWGASDRLERIVAAKATDRFVQRCAIRCPTHLFGGVAAKLNALNCVWVFLTDGATVAVPGDRDLLGGRSVRIHRRASPRSIAQAASAVSSRGPTRYLFHGSRSPDGNTVCRFTFLLSPDGRHADLFPTTSAFVWSVEHVFASVKDLVPYSHEDYVSDGWDGVVKEVAAAAVAGD